MPDAQKASLKLPTEEQIKVLHQKYTPSQEALEDVFVHCQIVKDIAESVATGRPGINMDLVRAGALLHDIGVYKLINNNVIDKQNYITHGLLGYRLLIAEGMDEAVCRFALLHTGVGITEQDIKEQNLPLPRRDYIAETPEERIVMFADKFHSKSEPPSFNSARWYENYLSEKFGAAKAQVFQNMIEEFGEPDIGTLSQLYNQPTR